MASALPVTSLNLPQDLDDSADADTGEGSLLDSSPQLDGCFHPKVRKLTSAAVSPL